MQTTRPFTQLRRARVLHATLQTHNLAFQEYLRGGQAKKTQGNNYALFKQ